MPENKFSASGDSTPAIVTDHPFQPDKRGWWSLCEFRDAIYGEGQPYLRPCHLAEYAHATTTVKDEDRRGT
jgi:hypothetical protein